MKKFKKILLISFSTSLIFIACKDDDDVTAPATPAVPTASQNIVDKDFRVSDILLTANGDTISTFANLDDCDKDDIRRFNVDGTGKADYGVIKCDPNDPQSESFTWALLSNDTKLTIDYGDEDADTSNILINSGTILKLENRELADIDTDGNLDTIIAIITFTKI